MSRCAVKVEVQNPDLKGLQNGSQERLKEESQEQEQEEANSEVEARHLVDYFLDIIKDINSGNLKSVVEFLDREIESLRFIFDSCISGVEMERLVNETVFHVSDLTEIKQLAVLLTEIRYSLHIDSFKAREKLKNILIEHASRAAGGRQRLLAIVL